MRSSSRHEFSCTYTQSRKRCDRRRPASIEPPKAQKCPVRQRLPALALQASYEVTSRSSTSSWEIDIKTAEERSALHETEAPLPLDIEECEAPKTSYSLTDLKRASKAPPYSICSSISLSCFPCLFEVISFRLTHSFTGRDVTPHQRSCSEVCQFSRRYTSNLTARRSFVL